jgi:hypothetical protein
MVVNSDGNSTIRAFFKSLIKGIQNGQILKSVVRILIKRLKNQGIPILEELQDVMAGKNVNA